MMYPNKEYLTNRANTQIYICELKVTSKLFFFLKKFPLSDEDYTLTAKQAMGYCSQTKLQYSFSF